MIELKELNYTLVDSEGRFVGYDMYDDTVYSVDSITQSVSYWKLDKITRLKNNINESYYESDSPKLLNHLKFPLKIVKVEMGYEIKEVDVGNCLN